MASSAILKVKPDFDIEVFVGRLADMYVAKGYKVNAVGVNGGYILGFEKENDGINRLLGMGEAVKANCTYVNGVLTINFVDEAWTEKIIALAIGWILCFIPLITGIIGCVKQYSLPDNIKNDANLVIAGM